jgi:hypothetical protein
MAAERSIDSVQGAPPERRRDAHGGSAMRRLGFLFLGLLSAAAGCGSGSSPGGAAGPNDAVLRIELTDSPVDGADAVFVTIVRVEVLRMGAQGEIRETVVDESREYDLLTLRIDVTAVLGEVVLPPGDYTGLRLYLAPTGLPTGPRADSPHRIVIGGEEFPLFVPSGSRRG